MVGNEEVKVKGTWGGARPNTGGARAGAGRKPIEGGKKRTMVMTDFEYDFVRDMLKKLRKGETVMHPKRFVQVRKRWMWRHIVQSGSLRNNTF